MCHGLACVYCSWVPWQGVSSSGCSHVTTTLYETCKQERSMSCLKLLIYKFRLRCQSRDIRHVEWARTKFGTAGSNHAYESAPQFGVSAMGYTSCRQKSLLASQIIPNIKWSQDTRKQAKGLAPFRTRKAHFPTSKPSAHRVVSRATGWQVESQSSQHFLLLVVVYTDHHHHCIFFPQRTRYLSTDYIYIKFVGHDLEVSHSRHICNCWPVTISYEFIC
jgi:hypothetical protein